MKKRISLYGDDTGCVEYVEHIYLFVTQAAVSNEALMLFPPDAWLISDLKQQGAKFRMISFQEWQLFRNCDNVIPLTEMLPCPHCYFHAIDRPDYIASGETDGSIPTRQDRSSDRCFPRHR